LNVLGIFDGIATGRYSSEIAGIHVDKYFASEINANAIKISEKNYPDIIQLGDVTQVDVSKLPKIDLLIGGSPCQGFSRAGLCLNFDDPRSKLFFEYVRILNEIRKVNPDVKFILENVEMKKEWVEVINDHLGVEGYSINSKLLSAHNRPRMYWTNIDFKKPIDDAGVKLLDILEEVDTTGFINHNGILFDPRIREDCRNLVSVVNGEVRISQATKLGYAVAENGDGVSLDFPTSKTRRGRVIKGKSSCLTTSSEPLVYVNGAIRWLTITEKERLQTLPDGYTEGVSYGARVEALGNGWTAEVITHILKGLKV
jgi:DNA (cytosine-5)-methyltransferase 3A